MRGRRFVWSAVAVVLVEALALPLLGLAPAASAADTGPPPSLVGTGSSFAGLALTRWAAHFDEDDAGAVDYSVSSSVLGLDIFCAETADFAATEVTYADDQGDCTADQVPFPFQYLPVAGGGLAFEYNLRTAGGTPITDLVLDATVVGDIFTGAIGWWDDPRIEALNPTLHLPHQRIVPFYRSEPSGENYLLTQYLLQVAPRRLDALERLVRLFPTPGLPSAIWPVLGPHMSSSAFPYESGLHPADSATAEAKGPLHSVGGIAYVETGDSLAVGLPVASLIDAAGDAAQPSSGDVGAALADAGTDADGTADLDPVFVSSAPDAYPLSAYTYLLVPCDPALAAAEDPPATCDGDTGDAYDTNVPPAAGAELGRFLDFTVCQGQVGQAELGYDPLPVDQVDQVFAGIGRIDGATEPPPPTPATCANPNVTGS